MTAFNAAESGWQPINHNFMSNISLRLSLRFAIIWIHLRTMLLTNPFAPLTACDSEPCFCLVLFIPSAEPNFTINTALFSLLPFKESQPLTAKTSVWYIWFSLPFLPAKEAQLHANWSGEKKKPTSHRKTKSIQRIPTYQVGSTRS